MTALEQRVFVGNLPEDVSSEELLKRLSSFKISSVDIKQRFTGNKKSTFAFVNVPKKCVNKFVRKLNNEEWNGSKLKIEFAKENFLDRLKREREMGNGKKNIHINNSNSTMNILSLNTSDNKINAATRSMHFDNELADMHNDVHELMSANDEVEQQITDGGNQMDKKQLSDMKRCKAMGEKNRLINLKRKQISISLNQNDQNIKPNKKIRFDDDDDNDLNEAEKSQEENQEKKKLFDDNDSSDESLSEIDFHLDENDNQHSSQIVKIKANLAGDQRFKLDRRFLDTNDNDNNGHDNVEKKKQLNILEKITGPVNCLKELPPSKAKIAGFQIKRYDPVSGEGEQNNVQPKQKIKKKKERKPTQKKPDRAAETESKTPELPVVVPQTRYYSVNEAVDFSHSSKEKSESFCLKSILECNEIAIQQQCHLERNEDGTKEDSSTSLKKPKLPTVPNSSLVEREILRKFTNTDDTDDTDNASNSDEMESSVGNRTDVINQQEPFTTWTEKFFFLDDDKRLEDADKLFEEFKNENAIYLKETLKSLLKSRSKTDAQNKNPGTKREKFIANGKWYNKGKKGSKVIR